MEEKSEQINIRASQRVARELRAEAQRRGLPLGETLAQLLALARSAPAAAAAVDSLLLHARDSGGSLPGPKSLKRTATSSAGDSQRAQSAEASDNDDEELDRVGIFSVFE